MQPGLYNPAVTEFFWPLVSYRCYAQDVALKQAREPDEEEKQREAPVPAPHRVPSLFSENVQMQPPSRHAQLPVILVAVVSTVLCLFECVRIEGFPYLEIQEQFMKDSMSIMAG